MKILHDVVDAVADFSQVRLRIVDLSSALNAARSLVFKKYHMSIHQKMQSFCQVVVCFLLQKNISVTFLTWPFKRVAGDFAKRLIQPHHKHYKTTYQQTLSSKKIVRLLRNKFSIIF